jgi:hypothetical protein
MGPILRSIRRTLKAHVGGILGGGALTAAAASAVPDPENMNRFMEWVASLPWYISLPLGYIIIYAPVWFFPNKET